MHPAEKFCGIVESTYRGGAAYTAPNIGKQLVIDMAPQGNGRYEGKVWRPSNDEAYLEKIFLGDDAMKLSGCVAGGLICSKQTWQRVE